ncbi:MAG: multidrug effflux MFS transporter [Sneathiella sp.]|nr:multidrug effflux MFS transporter [Sneathiella sp.]
MKALVPTTFAYTCFLSATVALGPLASDMYLPAFPQLERFFSASVGEIQWTLSIYLFGIAFFQLFYGPFTDRFGRKSVLLFGLVVFIGASSACFFATSIEQMTIFRFIQSFGISASVVVPRAMVRDLYERDQAAKQLSRMGSIMGFAPAIAPVLGGYIVIFYCWQGIFLCLAVIAVAISLVVLIFVEDSLKHKDLTALRPAMIWKNYYELLTHAEFMGYALTAALCFSGMFAFISGSSFVLINVFDVSTEHFGYYFGLVVIGFILGTLLGPRMTYAFGLRSSLRFGVMLSASGGIIMLFFALVSFHHPLAIALPMFLYNMGVGVVMPQCQAGAMAPFPEKAGAAAALTGFVILGFSAVVGLIVAELYDGTQMPMVGTICVMGMGSFIFFMMTGHRAEAAETR